MKESEARTKRCCGPFPCGAMRDDPDRAEHPVTHYLLSEPRYCIGSECMAWQVTYPPELYPDRDGLDLSDGHCGLT